jgi:hypothetical protein
VKLLDNVGHEHTDRPKNSGSKLDAIPQAYKIVTTSRFSPTEVGAVKLTCTRSRYGDKEREWTMRVGGGVFDLPQTASEAPDAKRARAARQVRETFRTACVAALQEQAPLGRDPLIDAARKRGVKRRNDALRDLLAELVADEASGIEQTPDGYALRGGPEDRGQGGATPWPLPVRGPGAGPPPNGATPDAGYRSDLRGRLLAYIAGNQGAAPKEISDNVEGDPREILRELERLDRNNRVRQHGNGWEVVQ